MGCNAWNHPADCNCGWGGDTGGSWGRVHKAPNPAFWWQWDHAPRHDSYVNPNASCPVCGAAVFFYQSPYGGRVFFDDLGPPWPKHPCTDNAVYRNGAHSIKGPSFSRSRKKPSGWYPLLASYSGTGSSDLVLSVENKLPGTVLFVPASYQNLGPIFFKKDRDDPKKITLSAWDNEAGLESTMSVSSWFRTVEDRRQHLILGRPPSPESLNALGWSWSFAHRKDGEDWQSSSEVDWKIARCFFSRAARAGNWSAANNLALIALNGLGKRPSPSIAFDLWKRSVRLSKEAEAIPLRHLAQCYRNGRGTSVNATLADQIDQKAESIERKHGKR